MNRGILSRGQAGHGFNVTGLRNHRLLHPPLLAFPVAVLFGIQAFGNTSSPLPAKFEISSSPSSTKLIYWVDDPKRGKVEGSWIHSGDFGGAISPVAGDRALAWAVGSTGVTQKVFCRYYDRGRGTWVEDSWAATSGLWEKIGGRLVRSDKSVINGPFVSESIIRWTYGEKTYTRRYDQVTGRWNSQTGDAIDRIPPVGTVGVKRDSDTNGVSTVELILSASDNSGSVASMRFSNDGSVWSVWEPYATTKRWSYSANTGIKKIYCQFADRNNNVSPSYTVSIVATPPWRTAPPMPKSH